MWSRLSRRGRKRQQGQVAILFAFSAVALIVIAGLALDVGRGFVDQRSLQGGADSASDAGARMVSADFHACLNGLTSPYYSDATISAVVQRTVGKAAAAQGKLSSYTASYVNGNGSAIGTVGSDSAGLTCTAGSPPTWSGAYGVNVHGTDVHSTMVLQLIGDKTGSEAASATSIFGVLAYGSPSLFTVWDLYCDGNSTGPPLAITNPPESITYRDNNWSGSNCNQKVNGNGFKGDLRAFTPDPFAVPGWVHTQPGTGTYTPVLDNVIILLPMMAPCPNQKACVALDGSQQSTGTPYFSTGSNEEMYMSGLIAVQTTDACGNPASKPCTGNVVAYFTDQKGVLVCPTQQQLGCQNAPTTNPAAPTAVELLS